MGASESQSCQQPLLETRTSQVPSADYSGLSENTLRLYKLSIKQKYETEWSSLSDKRMSLSDLYDEPMISDENDRFENITLDKFLKFYGPMTVILQDDSGSVKSIIVQKIMLNWASEAPKNLNVVFHLRCEELMFVYKQMNLEELLSYSCSLESDQISEMLQQSPEKILFIIDGFDELRLTQAIFDMSEITHPLQQAPPEVILCSLLRGYLIPETKLLVTTRTKNTVNKLLRGRKCFTEIMGFSEKKVETYFQTFYSEEYDCLRVNETLLTACSIPVICWIVSEMFRLGADVTSKRQTTTSIYVDFVSTLLEHHCQGLSQSVPTLLSCLGQLAESGMLERQVLFDEKNVKKIISDPDGNPFLCRFLSKRRIHQETMFTFMYHSFQEFFTALYYVLLDEEESARKVTELLHTVERGWALSDRSDRDFSMADVEVRHSKLLQPVILFLCGLCRKEWIPSFFEKHNMVFSVNIETQLKEWISTYSQRYQNEHMMFILNCLYELYEKSFIRKVLEKLVLIDLSNSPLKTTDCCALKYCLQCCKHIRHLKLHVTSDNLKMLQPELSHCKELWLMMDHISDDVLGLVSAAAEGQILDKLKINFSGQLKLEYTQFMKTSLEKMGWTLTVCGESLLIKPCMERFTEEKLMTKQEKSESGRTLPQGEGSGSVSSSSLKAESPLKAESSLTVESPLKAELSLKAESSAHSSSEDVEVFTPELRVIEGKLENTYRFVCSHVGQFQCSLTNLVFVMEGEGEVLYRVDSWDPRLLDGLGQMQPAGPLYNIVCSNGSLSGLQFPHCEILSEENKDILAVAHLTGGNVETMKPLKVTETHVIIDIRDLSLFGLIKRMFFPPSPVIAQVLLFVRPITMGQKKNILDVHLLPWNIALSKVKDQHRESGHIVTSSKCFLVPGTEYSMCCEPEGSTVQPKTERFDCNFGPNFHPTFEVFGNFSTLDITLSLLDSGGREVWNRQIILA